MNGSVLRADCHHERFDASFDRSVAEPARQFRFGGAGGARQGVGVARFDFATQRGAVAVGERRDAGDTARLVNATGSMFGVFVNPAVAKSWAMRVASW